jgi:hypothetical protein
MQGILERVFHKEAQVLVTLKSDGIPWNLNPVPSRIFAVGDVHGDIVGLACILRDRELIDKKGRWTGGDAHMVLNGDLVGGKNARLLLQFVLRLQTEAMEAGGALHPLLGNHDIQVFFKEYQKRKGKTLFKKYRVNGAKKKTIRDAFLGHTDLAGWVRTRNAVIQIGPTIFTHAGMNTWAYKHNPGRINSTIRSWIRFWQGIDVQPDPRTKWAVLGPRVDWTPPSTGPLWTRSYKVKKKSGKKMQHTPEAHPPSAEELSKILKKYKAARMVIGHTPVSKNKISLSHPLYGKKVVMIDSRISKKKGGSLSCVEINGSAITAHYAKRHSAGEKIADLELKKLKKENGNGT